MTLHGTLDDIFKDAPVNTTEPVVSEENSELARVAAELQNCQSQLSQLIELVQGDREQAPAADGTRSSRQMSPDPRARAPRKASSEGESDAESAKKVRPKKRRAKSGSAAPDGVAPTLRLHVT